MAGFFASGAVADLILLVLAVETALLVAWHRRTGRGLPPRAALALRSALTGAWWGWTALWLVAAFAAHLFDLAQRWRR